MTLIRKVVLWEEGVTSSFHEGTNEILLCQFFKFEPMGRNSEYTKSLLSDNIRN
jgi:hypothetical protein